MARAVGRGSFAVRPLATRPQHRLLWHRDGLAVATALLSGMIAVRVLANLGMILDMVSRGGKVQLWQFACAHAVVCLSYLCWMAPRRRAAVNGVLAPAPWMGRWPSGRRVARAAAGRATLGSLALLVPGAAGLVLLVSSAPTAPDGSFAAAVICAYVFLVIAAPLFAGWLVTALGLDAGDLEIIQVLGLVFLFSSNPDISASDNGAVITFFMTRFDPGAGGWVALLAAMTVFPVVATVIVAGLDRLAKMVGRRIPRSGLRLWYARMTTGPWILVFLLMAPVTVSGAIASGSRRWLATTAAVALLAWLAGVIGKMDQSVGLRWNVPLARRSRLRLLLPTLAIHVALSALAVVPALLR